MNTAAGASPQEAGVPGVGTAVNPGEQGAANVVPLSKPDLIQFSSKEASALPQHGADYDRGFHEGQDWRKQGMATSTYVLIGRDEYCLGFRAGYFASERKPLRAGIG